MTSIGESVATNIVQRLVEKIIKELKYFRDFEDHERNFDKENNILGAKREDVRKDIEDAKNKNENQIKYVVQNWITEADIIIEENTKIKQTRSYGCHPCWQYRQGKRLAKRTLIIKDHIERYNFDERGVARPAELPGMRYHASKDFIDFESRKTEFEQLVRALEDGNHYIIGLQGMGGTGKTTLAKQVGKQVEESKAFEKVIFVVVSNPPDVNKIRGDIARELGLHLEEGVEANPSKLLWSEISNHERKLLIILDDVWEELNLTDIGIPAGLDKKNCYVLITTRDSKVCDAMGCQQNIVRLRTLDDEDASTLFLSHAGNNPSESLARIFAKECGGLPVAIVALATALRNRPINEWNVALTTLRKSKPLVGVDKDLVKIYNSLKLSYDNLNDEEAQRLFLLCSIFPEDYEIPINLITRLGIGSGIFEEADEYDEARNQALTVKNKLIASSLLLEVEQKECVKMHDLVREVAQWMAKEDIQVIMNSSMTLKANKKFVFWSAYDFPDQFDGTKLEILLLWIRGSVMVKDPNAFFAGMSRLKLLFLLGEYGRKVPIPSLSHSLLSLKHIHTLILDGWEVGDISVLKNLQSLVTLELKNCLIIELPKDIKKLKKLRWLGLRTCEIQKNNPFEVIKRCLQLEEIYFVGNYNVKNWKSEDDKEIEDEITLDIPSSALQVFSIACDGFKRFANVDNGIAKSFNGEHMKHLISEGMFKYLVGSAGVLELGNLGQTGWKSLVPDIIPAEDGGKNNLVKLYLYNWADIEFLIDTYEYHYSNLTAFSNLVELGLDGVDVKELCHGAMPSGFLGRLQILKLEGCKELQNIFLDENLKLPHLKVLNLIDCPMFQPSIFKPSIARSLGQLEKLAIEGCKEIKSLIADDGLEEEIMAVDYQNRPGLLFPALESLQIKGCGKLEKVSSFLLAGDLPKLKSLYIWDCAELKYIFSEYREMDQVLQQEIKILPSLTEVRLSGVASFINIFQKCKKCVPRPPHQVFKEDSKERHKNFKTSSFLWAHGCCFLAPTKDANIGASDATLLEDHTISQESSCAPSSKKIEETFHTAECLMRQPLSLLNIRRMTLWGCSKLKSLFNVSIATTIMLEKLEITYCEELKHIITNKAEDDDARLNCTSIFPKLETLDVLGCNKLEFIFPSPISRGLQQLKSIGISGAKELKYVFGKYGDDEERVSNENENNEPHIHLPALESLCIGKVPNMISVVINKHQPACPSLPIVEAPKETRKHMQDVISEGAKEFEIQETVNVETPLPPSVAFQHVLNFCNIKKIEIWINKKLKTLFSISACRNLPQLSELYIRDCEELVNVVEDDSNHHHHVNYSSIFPKLEDLDIMDCNKLEFIFPLSLFGTLQKLKSLGIWRAAELKYIFGKYYDDGDYLTNENESDALRIHLPALEKLSLVDVPKLINNIRAKKYHLSFPPLQSIGLDGLQEFNGRSFPDLMAHLQGIQLNVKAPKDLMKMIKDVQNLSVRDSKIEEVLNLDGVEIEGRVMTLSLEEMRLHYLSELRHICRGPNYILSLSNLQELNIIACKKLRAIFSVSIEKSLPQLSYLSIKDCDELVDIIEECDGDHLHQRCFPKLEQISIECCNSLKCLFSISTCVVFPKLEVLEIIEASELEQIFICKQDNMQEMAKMEEVFPNLSNVTLRKLPRLTTICEGIDFKAPKDWNVDDCPKYQETIQFQEEPKDGDAENQAATNDFSDFAESSKEAMKRSFEEVASSMGMDEIGKEIEAKDPAPTLEDQVLKGSTAKPHLRRTSPHIMEETLIEIQAKDPTPASGKQASETSTAKSQLKGTSLLELEDEHKTSGSTTQLQQEDPAETKITKASQKTNVPFDDNNAGKAMKESVEEVPISNKSAEAALPSSSTFKTGLSTEKTAKEVEAKEPTQALAKQAFETSTANLLPKTASLHELKDEQTMKEPVGQLQHQNLGETKTTIEVPQKTNITLDDDNSTDAMSKGRVPEGHTSEDFEDLNKKKTRSKTIMTHQQERGEISASVVENIPRETGIVELHTSAIYSEAGGSKSGPSTIIDKETGKEIGKAVPASKLPAAKTSQDSQNSETGKEVVGIASVASVTITSSNSKVDGLKETAEQGFQEHVKSKEDMISIQQKSLWLRTQSGLSSDNFLAKELSQNLETGKEVVGLSSEASVTAASSNSKSSRTGKETEILVASQSAMSTTSTNSESTEDRARGSDETSPMAATSFDSTVEQKLENASKPNLPNVIPSPYHQSSQIGTVSPSTLGILEIFRLVKLKEGEAALLAQALEQYPELLLPREQRPHQIIEFSYRVLVDILVMLENKTPCTITTSEKSTLKDKLWTATYLGFNKGWVDTVRAKVFGADMSDVSSAQAKIGAMEAKLETCEVKLKQVQKEKEEARRDLEKAQSELRDILSAKNTPFGI